MNPSTRIARHGVKQLCCNVTYLTHILSYTGKGQRVSDERESVCVRIDGQSHPSAPTTPTSTAAHRLPRDRPGRAITVPPAAETAEP